jgi:ribosomal protein L19
MTIEEAHDKTEKNIENIITSRFSDLEVPNEVQGIVVAKKNKNRFVLQEKIFVMLDIKGFPIVALSSTIAMNINNLQVGKKYKFRRYNLFYTKDKRGKQFHSFCYDRGEEFDVVGNAGKVRYYQARK